MKFSSLRVGQKLILALVATLIVVFVIAALVIRPIGSRFADQTASSFAATVNNQALAIVKGFFEELEITGDRVLGSIRMGYPDQFRIDESNRHQAGDRRVPSLYNGASLVNQNYTFLDQFLKETNSVATMFVRDGDDFVRISTSLKKEDGTRAVGTLLDRTHPAYEKVKSGSVFRGFAKLYGRDYYVTYAPLKEDGKVIGILSATVDITSSISNLKARLKSIKIGESGYVFVLSNRPGATDYGQFVVHPSLDGKSGLELTDADGKLFIKEMFNGKNGEIHYLWKRAGTSETAQAIVSYSTFEEMGWLICSRADVDELSKGVIAMEWATLIAGLLMLLALPALIFVFVRQIVAKPLSDLQGYCEQVERSKDFTLQVPVQGQDEVGKTAHSVEKLLNGLREAFTQILVRVEQLETASNELTASAEKTATNSESASDSASAMAASVEEMSVGINHISDSANEAAAISKDAGNQSNEGGKTILDTTSEMNIIANTMKSTSEVVSVLGRETQQISGIVQVITDLADQTNLLALNAAIEAARAGETGRGFAVVADEVRKLAERTRKATDEIGDVISSIQSRSDQAVTCMDEAMSQIQRGEALATQAGKAINEIRSGSERVMVVVRQITDSLIESSTASQNMANQTERVAQVAEESNHAAKQSKDSAAKVAILAREVRDTVRQFRI